VEHNSVGRGRSRSRRSGIAACGWSRYSAGAKGLIKGGLFVADSLKELMAEGGEQLSDLVAEARAEYSAGTTTQATTGN
jgi:hypothetical protein